VSQELPTVGIIGSGTMGQGIAQISALAGMTTIVVDQSQAALERAKLALEKILNRLVEKDKIQPSEKDAALGNLQFTTELKNIAKAQLVIEAIVEDLEIKRGVFRDLESLVGEDCIIATNTSSLSVTAIAAALAKPERVAGLHFFNPVPLMKVVEIISGARTHSKVIDDLKNWLTRVGHKGVLCIDTPGFIVNHAGRGYGTEALRILDEKIAPIETIDSVLKSTGLFRMGPFELMDLVGLDVAHNVMESIYHQFYQEPRFRPSPTTKNKVEAGLLGRKTSEGFYKYNQPDEPITDHQNDRKMIRSIWVPENHAKHMDLIKAKLNTEVILSTSSAPEPDCLILLPLVGTDLSTQIAQRNLDPTKTFAIDLLVDQKDVTLMASALCSLQSCNAMQSAFSLNDQKAYMIDDSPGFITQRVLAMIVNIGCEIVQREICSPEDLDSAVQLGLGYKFGPLSLGDRIGAQAIQGILENLYNFYGDPRYRPSSWLKRRANLNMPLTNRAAYKLELDQ